MAKKKSEEPFRPLWNKLSPAEQDIMGWIKFGLANREIAERRGSSHSVVRNQTRAIYIKLGIDSPAKGTSRAMAVAILLEEKHAAELKKALGRD